ncbi:MFS general substrate transporter [Auricularia subglabra TFB-10046 SS5]|nr:MFS general substrate transporter [Auricularia subglabra TFB-10046 SS5]
MALYSDDAASGVVAVHGGPSSPRDIIEYETTGLLSLPEDDREPSENTPLLASGSVAAASDKDVRPRRWLARLRGPTPYWVAILAVCGSLSRSMVLAPRVEVYTTIACRALVPVHHTNSGLPHTTHPALPLPLSYPLQSLGTAFGTLLGLADPTLQLQAPHVAVAFNNNTVTDDDDEPVTTLPPKECLKNPRVLAAAAKIQTLMTITMGIMSSITGGPWGQFGDRHGRRAVIFISSFGLMFVDVVFVLVSIPHSMFSGHGHKFLLVAPFVEGLLGGWTTFQAATNAYISDCTDHGSRARIFSRVSGIFYVGFALGPLLGNLYVKLHPSHTTDRVFYLSICLALVNLVILLLFVPESVSREERERRQAERQAAKEQARGQGFLVSIGKSISSFFSPLGLFIPKARGGEVTWSHYKDWNLTCLAIALFCYLLTVALFQLKYIYAQNVYQWDATQLSSYISIMGSVRGIHLLFILPAISGYFRRRSRRNVTLKQRAAHADEQHSPSGSPDEPPLDPAALSREIHFDLLVVKFSLALDFTSHLLVTTLAPPSGVVFTAITALSSMGAGFLPAAHSLSLCILRASGETAEVGKLFGALSVLQATGSTIFGPTLFGTLFLRTAARWPGAIFALAAALIFVAGCAVSIVRSRRYVPEGTLAAVRAHRSHWLVEEDAAPSAPPGAAPSTSSNRLEVPKLTQEQRRRQRGRSRRSKDLSGSFAERSRLAAAAADAHHV